MSIDSKHSSNTSFSEEMHSLPTNTTKGEHPVEFLEFPQREKVADYLFWQEGKPDSPESWMECFFKMSPHIVTVLEDPNNIDAQKEIAQFRGWFPKELEILAEEVIFPDSILTTEQLKKMIIARAAEYLYFSDVLPNKKNWRDVSVDLVLSSPNTKCIRESPGTGTTLDHIYEYPTWIKKELDDLVTMIKERSPIDFTDDQVLEKQEDLLTELTRIATDIITLELPIAEGTRERLDIVRELLREAVVSNSIKDKKPVIISLGSGTGRGVLEVIKDLQADIKEAIFVDFDKKSMDQSQMKANKYGIQSFCKFLPQDLSKVIGGKQTLGDFLSSNGADIDDETPVIIECVGMDDYLQPRTRRNFNANVFSILPRSRPESFYIVSHINKVKKKESYPQQELLEYNARWGKELKVQMYGASRGELIKTFNEASNQALGQPSPIQLISEKKDSRNIYHIFMFNNKEAVNISNMRNNPPPPSL